MKISILGAGAFGTALGGILANKGHDIDYYDSKVERESLKDALKNAKYMVLAIPSISVPYLLPHLPKDIPLIIATKGILDDKQFQDFKDIMVISGPGFADDIKAGKKTYLTVTDKRVIELFSTNYLVFDYTTDTKGVLMCGALKNVYAIYAGLLNLEKNTSPWHNYINTASKEMKEILKANGAKSDTVDLVCGIGDLKLTCDTPSRNYEFGQILRNNPSATPEKTVEGITALTKIKRGEIIIPPQATYMQKIIKEIPCH